MITAKQRREEEVILTHILDFLQHNEETVYIGQREYKSDFFLIFRFAYRGGYCGTTRRPAITGDKIWRHALNAGWVHPMMKAGEKRFDDIDMVQTWWDEWTFAWDRNPPPRKYVRKSQQHAYGIFKDRGWH